MAYPDESFRDKGKEVERITRALDNLVPVLEDLDLKFATKKVETIKLQLRPELMAYDARIIAKRISYALDELQSRIEDDLATRLLYYFDQNEAELIENGERKFSPETLEKFSDTTEDLDEAVKCQGFSRYTACVFHLMRAMERALHAIGVYFNAAIIDKNDRQLSWGKIVANVNHKVEAMPKGRKRDNWSYIMTSLHHVNVCWRNDTMHPKQTYTEEEAQAVLLAVKSFMHHLALELKGA